MWAGSRPARRLDRGRRGRVRSPEKQRRSRARAAARARRRSTGGDAMQTIKGPGLFLGQFAGGEAPFDTLPGIAAWAADCGYAAVQLPMWDGALHRRRARRRPRTTTRRRSWAGRRRPGSSCATRRATSRASSAPSTPPTTPGWTGSARRRSAATARPGRTWAVEQLKHLRPGLAPHGAHGARDLLGGARLALLVPLPAARRVAHHRGLRRTRADLAPDPRRLRGGGRGSLLRDPPRRGSVRRRDLRDVPGAGREPPALQASTTTPATS